jgi:opacity protein-like surface antigen
MDFGMHLIDLITGGDGRLTLGAEGAVTAGFGGYTGGNPSLDAKTLFLGAGPHIALENTSRFEPWVHGLVGWDHLRFTQTATLGSNSALGYMLGGGVDFRLTPKIFWRFQGDYVGTNFQSSLQSNYSTGTGVVLYF